MDIRIVDVAREFGGAHATAPAPVGSAPAGSAPALGGVSLDIRAGELMALLGPSGSGKTTLLRVVAGLETADRGQVFFGDIDATRLSVQERNVGFVFQHYALFRHMSVADNISYGLRVRPRALRPAKAVISRRVEELLALMQLEGLGGRYPAQLSGGQRQRVALARALAVEPRVLLLDEPFGALDARVRKDLRAWLRQIHRQTGHTTIFVTHDQDEALELADRVAILNKGRLEQVGTPDDIHDSPATAFVASFVGDGARLPAEIRAGSVYFNGVAAPAAAAVGADGPAWLWARVFDLRIVPAGEGQASGVVSNVRRTSSGRRLEVMLAGVEAPVEVDAPHGMQVEPGAAIAVAIVGGRAFARTD